MSSTLFIGHMANLADVWRSHSDGTFGSTSFPNVGDIGGVNYRIGFRCPGVTVPKAATILHAALIPYWVDARTLPLEVACVDVDNGGTYADQTAWNAAARTPFSATFTAVTVGASRAIACDCTDQVQQVLNRAGWLSGNTLEFDLGGDGTGTAKGRVYANNTSHTSALQLSIAYTTDPPAGGGRPNLLRRLQALSGASLNG